MIGSRYIRDFEKDGIAMKAVSLGVDTGQEAIISAEDFDLLFKLGLSVSWRLIKGYVMAPTSIALGGYIPVGRVLLNAAAGWNINYIDGNKLNLRRDNMILERGRSKLAARDYVLPPIPEGFIIPGPRKISYVSATE